MRFRRRLILLLAAAGLFGTLLAAARAATPTSPPAAPADVETVRIATYNIENFARFFDQHDLPFEKKDKTEFFRDEEDLYEVARVIKSPAMNADIVVLQEACSEKHLQEFNSHWLWRKYDLVKVLPNNTTREQNTAILARKGFVPLEIRSFRNEPDPVDDPKLRNLKQSAGLGKGNLLFARGPAFVLFQTPKGNRIWVGTDHTKSKYGNSEAVTKWRIRATRRLREICGELIKEHKTPWLYVGGDFNDSFGLDEHERKLGQDSVRQMVVGQGDEKLVSLTLPLVEKDPKRVSYHGEIKPARLQAFVDHVFASPALAALCKGVTVVDPPIAAVASDHYPVVAEFALPLPAPDKAPQPHKAKP